jgi:hypothetical protein
MKNPFDAWVALFHLGAAFSQEPLTRGFPKPIARAVTCLVVKERACIRMI